MWRNYLGKANVIAVKIDITLHQAVAQVAAAVSEQIAQCVQEKGNKAWYFLQRMCPFELNMRVDKLLVWLSFICHFCFLWPFTWPCKPLFPCRWFFLTLCESLVAKYYFLNNIHGHFRMEHCCATGESRITLKFAEFWGIVHWFSFLSLWEVLWQCQNKMHLWMNLIALGKFSSALIPLYNIIQADISS